MVEKTIEIDLGRAVRLDELPAIGGAILRWWSQELLEAMPAALRRVLPQRRPEARVFIATGRWRIQRDGADDVELETSNSDEALRAEVGRHLPDSSDRKIIALIGEDQALIRGLQLPMLTDARVRPAVELQIDRLTPFKVENVRFGCRVIERRIEENDMTVEVAVVPRAMLSAIEARLEAVGLKPASIDVADRGGNALGFALRDEGRSDLQRKYRLINAALALGAVLAWLMAYYAFGAAAEAEIAWWQARAAELRPQAQRSADLARRIEALSQPIEIGKSRASVSALEMLMELTKILPNNTHLFELRMNGASVEVTGAAVDAPSLIAKLDASKLFAETRFRAPITRRQGPGDDRFEIALKLKEAAK